MEMVLSAILFLAGLAPVSAQSPAYTLAAAVDAVLQRNPGVESAGRRVAEAEAAQRETRTRRLPTLAVNSSFTRGDNPVYVFGTLMNQRSFTQADFALDSLNHPGLTNNFRSSFELGVPLFTGFQLQSRERLGRLGRDAAASGHEAAAQSARYSVVESFLQVLLQKGLLETLQSRVDASAADVESARRLREKGLVLGSDYYAAQATLGGLQAWRIRADAGLAAAKSRLAALLGVSASALDVKGTLSHRDCAPESESELVAQALRQRPELAAAALQEQMAGVSQRQAGLSLLPAVEAFGAMETDTRDFQGNPWNKMFGVRARLPLGDPSYLPRRSRARAALEASRAEARGARESIGMEVSQVYEGWRGACASLPVAKDTADKARQSLELFRPLYREGRQSIIEVLRAEEGMAKAQAAYLESLYGVHAGRARLLLAAGALDSAAIGDLERGLEAAR
ncbi:MAG: TolC family protein [Elusimicrobia bacterium]|nr:TolC family protein [Elusimicrobiota bacterium]